MWEANLVRVPLKSEECVHFGNAYTLYNRCNTDVPLKLLTMFVDVSSNTKTINRACADVAQIKYRLVSCVRNPGDMYDLALACEPKQDRQDQPTIFTSAVVIDPQV